MKKKPSTNKLFTDYNKHRASRARDDIEKSEHDHNRGSSNNIIHEDNIPQECKDQILREVKNTKIMMLDITGNLNK